MFALTHTFIKVFIHENTRLGFVSVHLWVKFVPLWLWVCVCVCAGLCDQVDNSCFCSLCRLVFQDISGRLPQVGFTHSVWEPVCILLVSNDCVLLDIIDHLRLKRLLCLLLLTHWILTRVELRKGEKRIKLKSDFCKACATWKCPLSNDRSVGRLS